MALTAAQTTLLRESWAALEAVGLTKVGLSMYSKAFGDNPQMVPLFRFAGNKPVAEVLASAGMEKQAGALMTSLGVTVGHLDDADTMDKALTKLGARHKAYNTKTDQFPIINAALIHAFSAALGDKFTTEVSAAWNAFLAHVTDVMSGALQA